jgi:PGAP1-like protein
VDGGLAAALSPYASRIAGIKSTPQREAVLAALNGVVGDHLAATKNPLEIAMRLRRGGIALEVERSRLAAAIPEVSDKVLLFVHGLCMNDLQWSRGRRNRGTDLAREFGWTPVHLHYNTGLHVSTNGRALASLLEQVVSEWPVAVRELAIIGHSCGGLLARSAHFYGTSAGHRWPKRLRYLVFLGTPHHGSALERAGNYATMLLRSTAYSLPFARIARIRSAGITDMRYGNLVDEDWQGIDRFQHSADRRLPLPLPGGVRCFAIAASKRGLAGGVGDGLVSVDSALGRHKEPARTLEFAQSDQWIAHGMTHGDLLTRAAIYRKLGEWLAS